MQYDVAQPGDTIRRLQAEIDRLKAENKALRADLQSIKLANVLNNSFAANIDTEFYWEAK